MPTSAPTEPRYCRCGARIARDNREEECSPCQARERDRQHALAVANAERRGRVELETRALRSGLVLADVPLPGEPDELGSETVRRIVYFYALKGDYGAVAQSVGFRKRIVSDCLKRPAAQSIIELMIEEGTWPEATDVVGL